MKYFNVHVPFTNVKNLGLGHSNVFICFASFKNPKTYQLAREKTRENNKIHADILELFLIIRMSHINGKGLDSTN
jgi:predicted component of type VI protein secretion system